MQRPRRRRVSEIPGNALETRKPTDMKTHSWFLGLILAGQCASADVTTYVPTRDTYMRGSPTDLHGSDPSGRAAKAFLDFYISDYDRTAINGSIQAQLGHPLTFNDMENVELSLNFFSNDFEGYKPTALARAAIFQGTQNWVEGTNLTSGATKGFAFYDPANPGSSQTWKNRAGADVPGFLNLDRIENVAYEEWGGSPFTYRKWVLDDNVAFAYLTDPLSLGLFLNSSDAGNPDDIDAQYNNTEVFSREHTDLGALPYLELTVIPEPGFSGLVMFGALLAARRRRAQV